MKEITKALRPVKRRMRAQLAFAWAVYGVLVAGVCVVLLRVACFLRFLAFARVLACGLLLGIPLLFALVAWLWPIPDVDAARRADELGLMARAQTAVMLDGCDTPMARMQRSDALSSLKSLDPAKSMRLRAPRFAWIGIGVCALLLAVSFVVPNPQAQKLRERAAFQQEMRQQADQVEKGAAALNAEDPETPELKKLLGDLALALRQSQEAREALSAVDALERGVASIRQRTAGDALAALQSSGLDTLAQALQSGKTDAAQSALEDSQATSRLSKAASSAQGSTAAHALQGAAKAAASGNAAQAAKLLQAAVSGQSVAGNQALALAAMARKAAVSASGLGSGMSAQAGNGTGRNGQGTGAGSKGQAGAGAGVGSSNRDGGVTQGSQSGSGSRAPQKKVEDYETIYDPTRLGGAGQSVNDSGTAAEGERTEVQLGTGLGTVDGAVPYTQALPEYAQAAVEAVEGAGLPAYAQQWVESYFNALAGNE